MENKYCIDMLLGGELCEIGRVTDLVWWEFEKDGILYSLHTQCSFRVTHEGVSVLTRRSIYNIIDEKKDSKSNSLFDKNVITVNCLLPLKVLRVECSNMNDLLIVLSNQVCIEIFADSDVEDEQWRFFMIVDEDFPALVAYSNRVEY